MQNVDKIKEHMTVLEGELEKLEVKKVKAAAARVRKSLQEIAKCCKEGRKEAQEIKNSI